MELWDIYDSRRLPTGRTQVRGVPLAPGDYHLVVLIWMIDPSGRLLLTKRHPDKPWPGLWECTGGSALAGEDSERAARREVAEETGFSLNGAVGRIICRYAGWDTHYDVWLFIRDIDLNAAVLQDGETTDIRLVSKDELKDMFDRGLIVPTLSGVLEWLETDIELRTLVK